MSLHFFIFPTSIFIRSISGTYCRLTRTLSIITYTRRILSCLYRDNFWAWWHQQIQAMRTFKGIHRTFSFMSMKSLPSSSEGTRTDWTIWSMTSNRNDLARGKREEDTFGSSLLLLPHEPGAVTQAPLPVGSDGNCNLTGCFGRNTFLWQKS